MYRLLSVALVATVALAAEEKSTVKNATARGYYGGASNDPVPVATQPIYYPVFPPPPRLEDRNVCDLDAGVLLVTNHRRRHNHYKAIRVRCSEIANYDEDSCNVCCQNAARRDSNLPNSAMFGFLALTDDDGKHFRHHRDDSKDKSPEDLEEDLRRMKRGADHHSEERSVEKTRVGEEKWKPDPQYKDVKCVCCAPKRPLPVFTFPQPYPQPYAQPYGQAAPPQYQAQPYGQQPTPVQYQGPAQVPSQYQQPAQTPSQYQPPAQSPPAQQYQPVQYQQPPAQSPPQNYQPAQSQPVATQQTYQPAQQNPQPY